MMDIPIERKWYQRRRVRWTFFAVLIASGFVLLGLMAAGHSSPSVSLAAVEVATVETGLFRPSIPVTGTIVPNRTVYVDAIEGGQVQSILRESGRLVEAGDTILQLANSSLLLDVMSQEANLIEQQTNLRNTRLAIEHNALSLESRLMETEHDLATTTRLLAQNEALRAKRYISESEYEDVLDRHEYLVKMRDLTQEQLRRDSSYRHLQLAALDESADRIAENLRLIARSLDALVIRAPESGLLVQMTVQLGESVAPGQRLAQIDASDGFKVLAFIDEYYRSDIRNGLQAEVTIGGSTHFLRVVKVSPQVRDGRFEIELEFDELGVPDLARGQSVHARLFTDDVVDGLLLSRGPFYERSGGQWAYVISRDGTHARRTAIRLGRQNINEYEVLEGLNAGDRVIISSYDRFSDASSLEISE